MGLWKNLTHSFVFIIEQINVTKITNKTIY